MGMKKLTTIEKLKKEIKLLKAENKKLGYCYGVFDLIHRGHVKHLEEAKKLCDVLIVGITADKHVKNRKGPNRPIFNEKHRAYLISQLRPVDFVFIRHEDAAVQDIKRIKPDLCIKGGDYLGSKDKYLRLEMEAARAVGGKMVFTKTRKYLNVTTTKILAKLNNDK